MKKEKFKILKRLIHHIESGSSEKFFMEFNIEDNGKLFLAATELGSGNVVRTTVENGVARLEYFKEPGCSYGKT